MTDPSLIKNLEDLQSYIEWIKSLCPKSTSDPEYKILKEFKYFSPERVASKISANKIQTSRWINKVKSEIWRKANKVEIVEKMNKEIPKIGEPISYWNPWNTIIGSSYGNIGQSTIRTDPWNAIIGSSYGNVGQSTIRTEYYSSNCICLNDFKSSGTDRSFFYCGVIYQYTKIDYNGKYLIVWRSKPDQRLPATRTYNVIIDPQEFESNFKDLRDHKIESILNL